MNIIPTPEQMDAHERDQWAAWHEQHRQPAPASDGVALRRRVLRMYAEHALWTVVSIVAGLALIFSIESMVAAPGSTGPHLRLDLKIAGVPQ